jgi:formamidopyrimidine-DNA glycosylase
MKKSQGRVISSIDCYGKILFINASEQPIIMAQLGMTGRLTVEKINAALLPHTHLRWKISSSDLEIRYVDPRRFGLINSCDVDRKKAIIDKLGPDPFSWQKKDFKKIKTKFLGSKRFLKEALLDQNMIAGVGNIYASEALFDSSISPLLRANELSEKKYEKLFISIEKIMKLAYKNCGTSFSDYVDGSGKTGDNLRFLQVFQRALKPCNKCRTKITRIIQGGRSTFFCRQCQK